MEFCLDYMNHGISVAFMMPRNILQESAAIWQGNVNVLQKTVLDATIEGIVNQIKDELLNKVIKPLISINFGETNSLGGFSEMISRDPTSKAMHLQNLITAISMQLIDGTDVDIQNKVRDLLDLPELKASADSSAYIIKNDVSSPLMPTENKEDTKVDSFYADEVLSIQ